MSSSITRSGHGYFQKGAPSPNPGGKPKAQQWSAARVARRLAEETNDFEEVIEFVVGVLRSKPTDGYSVQDKKWAIEWISSYGLGRPVTTLDLHGTVLAANVQADVIAGALNVELLGDAQLDAYQQMLRALIDGGVVEADAVELEPDEDDPK